MSAATPTNLKVTPGVESLALSWGVSGESLGAWLLHWRAKGTAIWITETLASTVRSYLITGLQAESYEVQVRALVAGGLASATATPEAKPTPPIEPPPVKPPPIEPPKTSVIIGTNDFSGWQESPAKTMVAAGIKAGRIEGTGELSKAIGYGAVASEMMVIVGNTSDGSRLSTVNKSAQTAEVVKEAEACTKLGVGLLEFMNEPYLKGASHNKEGAKYAELYLSALAAIEAKGLKVRLLASLDCELSWVEAMPATFWASVQGFTIHPYGALSWSYGWAGYLKCLAYAEAKGANVGWFVSEDGVELNGVNMPMPAAGTKSHKIIHAAADAELERRPLTDRDLFVSTVYPGFSVPTEAERQPLVKSKIETYIASKVAGGCGGFYYYQSHNDSTGTFGFMDNTNKALPLMSTIAAFAA